MKRRNALIEVVLAPKLLRGVTQAFVLLTPREKVRAGLLVLSMNINAVLGLAGLAGLLPFVHLMLDPNPLDSGGWIGRRMRFIGIVDVDTALLAFGLALIFLVFAKNLYALVHTGFQNRFCASAESRLATDLLDRVVHAPYLWLVARNSSVVRDVVVGQSIEWSRGVVRPTLQIINDALFLLVAFGLLIATSPGAGFVVSISAIVLGALLMMLSRPRIAAYTESKRRAIRLAGVTASEAIAGGRDVRMSGAGPMMVATFARDMTDYANGDARGRQWQSVPRLGIEVIGFGALVGIALGALWSGAARADVAALLALYAIVAMRAIPIISQVTVAISAVAASLPAVAEVRTLRAELPPAEPLPPPAAPRAWHKLTFDDVAFTYPGMGVPALGPLSLTIERGRTYGIVGASGAGKSTLVDLLAGLMPASLGRVLLDGKVLAGIDLARWRQRIAYVAQTPFLIDASLAENIEFGQPDRPGRLERLNDVIAAAGLGDLVRSLPNGLTTQLGERGVRISGGQRQRVAIARALYRDADLLVLDEATSALDSLTERSVTDAIEALKGRLTLVVVAHRLSTVVRLDEIIMLEHGQIAARGAHADLLAASKEYRRLIEAQALPPAA